MFDAVPASEQDAPGFLGHEEPGPGNTRAPDPVCPCPWKRTSICTRAAMSVYQKLLEEPAKARSSRSSMRQRLGPRGQLASCRNSCCCRSWDEKWRDHLNELILLRSGIGLRSYGQAGPPDRVQEREPSRLFESLMESLEQARPCGLFMRAEIVRKPPEQTGARRCQSGCRPSHQRDLAPTTRSRPRPRWILTVSKGAPDSGRRKEHPSASQSACPSSGMGKRSGRNDPCPCGSGRKVQKMLRGGMIPGLADPGGRPLGICE